MHALLLVAFLLSIKAHGQALRAKNDDVPIVSAKPGALQSLQVAEHIRGINPDSPKNFNLAPTFALAQLNPNLS